MNFEQLQLLPALLRALGDEGYTTPTPIQVQAIPHVLAGRDLLGVAQTGTGKTAAFALPILQQLQATGRRVPVIRCLVLTPTWGCATPSSSGAWGRGPRCRRCARRPRWWWPPPGGCWT
jgi:ATP-dependent RNA helicase RhlE